MPKRQLMQLINNLIVFIVGACICYAILHVMGWKTVLVCLMPFYRTWNFCVTPRKTHLLEICGKIIIRALWKLMPLLITCYGAESCERADLWTDSIWFDRCGKCPSLSLRIWDYRYRACDKRCCQDFSRKGVFDERWLFQSKGKTGRGCWTRRCLWVWFTCGVWR